MPYVTDARTTYSLLACLVVAHITLNYLAVRTVVLRSLNRQRAGLLWHAYRSQSLSRTTPSQLSRQERIFARPSSLYRSVAGPHTEIVGHCYIGSSLSSILPPQSQAAWWKSHRPARWVSEFTPARVVSLIDRFAEHKFVVWFDRHAYSTPILHIILKEGHTIQDHLEAWLLATEIATRCAASSDPVLLGKRSFPDLERILNDAQGAIRESFPSFLSEIPKAGWDLAAAAGGFVTGLPTTLYVEPEEDRKSR